MKNVNRDEVFAIKGATFNEIASAVNRVNSSGVIANPKMTNGVSLPAGMAWCRNGEQEEWAARRAVALSDVLVHPDKNLSGYWLGDRYFLGGKVVADNIAPVAITADAIKPGELGKIMLSGMIAAKVTVVDLEHQFAEPVPDSDTGAWQSAATGLIRILWREEPTAESAEVYAVLQFGGGNAGAVFQHPFQLYFKDFEETQKLCIREGRITVQSSTQRRCYFGNSGYYESATGALELPGEAGNYNVVGCLQYVDDGSVAEVKGGGYWDYFVYFTDRDTATTLFGPAVPGFLTFIIGAITADVMDDGSLKYRVIEQTLTSTFTIDAWEIDRPFGAYLDYRGGTISDGALIVAEPLPQKLVIRPGFVGAFDMMTPTERAVFDYKETGFAYLEVEISIDSNMAICGIIYEEKEKSPSFYKEINSSYYVNLCVNYHTDDTGVNLDQRHSGIFAIAGIDDKKFKIESNDTAGFYADKILDSVIPDAEKLKYASPYIKVMRTVIAGENSQTVTMAHYWDYFSIGGYDTATAEKALVIKKGALSFVKNEKHKPTVDGSMNSFLTIFKDETNDEINYKFKFTPEHGSSTANAEIVCQTGKLQMNTVTGTSVRTVVDGTIGTLAIPTDTTNPHALVVKDGSFAWKEYLAKKVQTDATASDVLTVTTSAEAYTICATKGGTGVIVRENNALAALPPAATGNKYFTSVAGVLQWTDAGKICITADDELGYLADKLDGGGTVLPYIHNGMYLAAGLKAGVIVSDDTSITVDESTQDSNGLPDKINIGVNWENVIVDDSISELINLDTTETGKLKITANGSTEGLIYFKNGRCYAFGIEASSVLTSDAEGNLAWTPYSEDCGCEEEVAPDA